LDHAAGVADGASGFDNSMLAGTSDGTSSAARFYWPGGVAVDSAGRVYVADCYSYTIRVGAIACPDAPVIDQTARPVGELRQLDTGRQTAVAWQWRPIRIPAGSSAAFSADNVRNPTFTPDVADLCVFRLHATNAAGAAMMEQQRWQRGQFHLNLAGELGRTVVVEASTSLTHWTPIATNVLGSDPIPFTDPASALFRQRFYRLLMP